VVGSRDIGRHGGWSDDVTGVPEGDRAACGAGVFTTAILTFIYAWNEVLFANTFLFDQSTRPVTVVIPNFATIYTVDCGAQAAAAVVVTVPRVILVLIFQRRIVSGLTAGAVKG
jgi:multiple sugar transport system permease protein